MYVTWKKPENPSISRQVPHISLAGCIILSAVKPHFTSEAHLYHVAQVIGIIHSRSFSVVQYLGSLNQLTNILLTLTVKFQPYLHNGKDSLFNFGYSCKSFERHITGEHFVLNEFVFYWQQFIFLNRQAQDFQIPHLSLLEDIVKCPYLVFD